MRLGIPPLPSQTPTIRPAFAARTTLPEPFPLDTPEQAQAFAERLLGDLLQRSAQKDFKLNNPPNRQTVVGESCITVSPAVVKGQSVWGHGAPLGIPQGSKAMGLSLQPALFYDPNGPYFRSTQPGIREPYIAIAHFKTPDGQKEVTQMAVFPDKSTHQGGFWVTSPDLLEKAKTLAVRLRSQALAAGHTPEGQASFYLPSISTQIQQTL